MPDIRAQVILKTASNVPADFVTNSWCFSGGDTLTSTAALTTALKTFYDNCKVQLGFPSLAQNGHEIKWYDLPGVQPNYPFATTTWNFATAVAGNTFASEVALCMSFQGQKVPGFPQSRRRGRVYLGPVSDAISTLGRPQSAVTTAIASAGGLFRTAVSGITGEVFWSVWSPTDGDSVEITNGWVDNAWDIQRRRGLITTSRTTF